MISGQTAALLSAFFWALASLLYTRVGKDMRPVQMNFLKCVVAIPLLALTIILISAPAPRQEVGAITLLLLSGAIGIGWGDTAYFTALTTIGPRQASLLKMLSPPAAGLLALLFLQEQLQVWQWVGIGLTLAGVVWVISERTVGGKNTHQNRVGLWAGLLAAGTEAIGALLMRAALADTSVNPLWGTLIRLVGGVMILFLWQLWRTRSVTTLTRRDYTPQTWWMFGTAAFLGTYLGIWLMVTAFKYAPTGIVQTLLTTTPLFILAIVLVTRQEKVSWRAIIGAIVALSGIALLFAG